MRRIEASRVLKTDHEAHRGLSSLGEGERVNVVNVRLVVREGGLMLLMPSPGPGGRRSEG